MEWLRLAPPRPWVFNSGYADAIATESKAMQQYYDTVGLPLDQMVVTGSLADDVLADCAREANSQRLEFFNHLGLPDRPMLLCALPPDFLDMTGGRPECDFRTYEDLVRIWMESITNIRGFNTVVCLHPSVARTQMEYIQRFGATVAHQPTVSLVPLCDIYVASVSSTIRWAIACGKPVVNYDVYRYRYSDYKEVPGVLTVEDEHSFRAAIRRLVEDRAFYEETVQRQRSVAEHWGNLDGRASERMLALFDTTLQAYGRGVVDAQGRSESPSQHDNTTRRTS
jgi:hypothetical protein